MIMNLSYNTLESEQLRTKGYCLFHDVLDRPMLDDLRRVTDELLDKYPEPERKKFRYQGSNIGIALSDPVFARLVAWPKAFEVFHSLGFTDPRFWSGFLLSKPPHGPSLYWHQDWWAWDSPCSEGPEPPQVFAMYYLVDTSVKNGCLRLIPGTHYQRIPLHDQLPTAHTDESYESDNASIAHAIHPDEVNVTVHAGDLVIGDARLLHAAHANQTDQRRTCLTLWYLPHYASLPEPVRATVHKMTPATLWEDGDPQIVVPRYEGAAEGVRFNRLPDVYLPAAS